MIRHHSAIGVAAWTDLLRLLKDSRVSELRGAPKLKTIGKKKYWYDQYRLGTRSWTATSARTRPSFAHVSPP